MQIRVEAGPMKMADNAIMEAFREKKFGIRLTFKNDDNDARYEVILNHEEIGQLRDGIDKAYEAIAQAVLSAK